jgi:hypothetical protein
MARILLPNALLLVQLLNQSDCTALLIHYHFSYVPKFEARNIFYLIRVYTKIFIHLSPHFQHIVLINFILLTHLKNSPMNFSYHLFIPSFFFSSHSYDVSSLVHILNTSNKIKNTISQT